MHYDWTQKTNRRQNLADLERAIRAGWLATATPAHQAQLVRALAELRTAPDLTAREADRLGRIFDLIGFRPPADPTGPDGAGPRAVAAVGRRLR
jgi:hypothetical protein